ncbi:MAG: LysM peptidoglycan-binding domain-containing protein [Lysobacter sp.]|nr:MAG: LysM peptidoglycan-binding domain-containing protein [Lysobacter sp.]
MPAGSNSAWRPATVAAALLLLGACSSSVVREAPPRGGMRPVVSRPRPGASIVVQRGETLYAIATRSGVSVLDLASWNALAPPYTIYPGQRLRLYPGGMQPPQAAMRRPVGPSTPARSAVAPPPVVAPPASGFPWRWPAEGTLAGRFVAGEPTRQGVDIDGVEGAPVRAAADGTVVYSGAGLVGYGELVIIKHSEAWLSAYGHNRKRLVNEGQQVKAGQQIAEMGHSGAPRDMLHFEIRYNGKPVDPLLYLPPR